MGMTRALVACLLAAAACGVWAQEFEAASVKLHTSASPSTGRSGIDETKGLIRFENLSLQALIEIAYGVKDYQFVGPNWLGTISFDITAKPTAEYKHEQLEPLLRNLLASRFHLTVHHESKEISAYGLVIAKGGQKFPEAVRPREYFTARPGLISGTQVSMREFTGALGNGDWRFRARRLYLRGAAGSARPPVADAEGACGRGGGGPCGSAAHGKLMGARRPGSWPCGPPRRRSFRRRWRALSLPSAEGMWTTARDGGWYGSGQSSDTSRRATGTCLGSLRPGLAVRSKAS